MADDGSGSTVQACSPLTDTEQYKLLDARVALEHKRWTDNYRIFLTLAGALLAGEGLVLSQSNWQTSFFLSTFLVMLLVLGIVLGSRSAAFIQRPHQIATLWYALLRDMEQRQPSRQLPVFSLGQQFIGDGVASVGPAESPEFEHRREDLRPEGITSSATAVCEAFVVSQLVLGISFVVMLAGKAARFLDTERGTLMGPEVRSWVLIGGLISGFAGIVAVAVAVRMTREIAIDVKSKQQQLPLTANLRRQVGIATLGLGLVALGLFLQMIGHWPTL